MSFAHRSNGSLHDNAESEHYKLEDFDVGLRIHVFGRELVVYKVFDKYDVPCLLRHCTVPLGNGRNSRLHA